jgi:hypothetical protein
MLSAVLYVLDFCFRSHNAALKRQLKLQTSVFVSLSCKPRLSRNSFTTGFTKTSKIRFVAAHCSQAHTITHQPAVRPASNEALESKLHDGVAA